MKEAGNQNAVLIKTIDQMKQRLSQQEEYITNLENKLAVANDSIADLNAQVEAKEEQVQIQTEAKDAAFNAYQQADAQLNTVYYALGSSKELKENGLIEKKFLSPTKVLEGDDINLNYFTKADKRTLKSIPTGAKKAEIKTNVPADSYEIVKNADNTVTINITNPNTFWKYSPYLVVELK